MVGQEILAEGRELSLTTWKGFGIILDIPALGRNYLTQGVRLERAGTTFLSFHHKVQEGTLLQQLQARLLLNISSFLYSSTAYSSAQDVAPYTAITLRSSRHFRILSTFNRS